MIDSTMILPGATLGMLGGGQLGRMFTIAARTMGYRVVVLDPDTNSPAATLADKHLKHAYDDPQALDYLSQHCDVITTEFENIPADVLRGLAEHCPVRPSASALEKTQNRAVEKRFIQNVGLNTPKFAIIENASDLIIAAQQVPFPAILKKARFGYDGKGQVHVDNAEDLENAFVSLNSEACVLEEKINLHKEISVILARNMKGELLCYPVAENQHHDGILHMSIVPAGVDDKLQAEARRAAMRLARALQFCGVMAVEFFISKDGELLVNEIAPRVHNSGHYTLDACVTSQFEQQVRMICNLPFGNAHLLSPVAMVNLLGDVWKNSQPNWHMLLSQPEAKLHLYGKDKVRLGRKMGHYCCLASESSLAAQSAETIFKQL